VLSSRRYLVNSELVPASVRRFRTFGLLTAEPCLRDELCDDGGKYHKYKYSVLQKHIELFSHIFVYSHQQVFV